MMYHEANNPAPPNPAGAPRFHVGHPWRRVGEPGRSAGSHFMTAIEVHVNGKKQCVAGIARDGVVSAILSWVGRGDEHPELSREDVSLRVGGLDSKRDEHVDWLTRDMAVGDEIVLRIVDVRKLDAPKKERRPGSDTRRRQKAHVRRMAKQFGWKIQTQ